ncbi:hypothetical protein PAPYR_2384 [Paratrimastix pyriformis]|uniref:Uncharacterized protein n=1 Tax=Paratrimastix pyriformis TaxID=342808 RepID=A0ABQ8UR65_9EUKA|nr:hypothetical protein PAPYR_2384 [Paratrimastix pyriformis]
MRNVADTATEFWSTPSSSKVSPSPATPDNDSVVSSPIAPLPFVHPNEAEAAFPKPSRPSPTNVSRSTSSGGVRAAATTPQASAARPPKVPTPPAAANSPAPKQPASAGHAPSAPLVPIPPAPAPAPLGASPSPPVGLEQYQLPPELERLLRTALSQQSRGAGESVSEQFPSPMPGAGESSPSGSGEDGAANPIQRRRSVRLSVGPNSRKSMGGRRQTVHQLPPPVPVETESQGVLKKSAFWRGVDRIIKSPIVRRLVLIVALLFGLWGGLRVVRVLWNLFWTGAVIYFLMKAWQWILGSGPPQALATQPAIMRSFSLTTPPAGKETPDLAATLHRAYAAATAPTNTQGPMDRLGAIGHALGAFFVTSSTRRPGATRRRQFDGEYLQWLSHALTGSGEDMEDADDEDLWEEEDETESADSKQ